MGAGFYHTGICRLFGLGLLFLLLGPTAAWAQDWEENSSGAPLSTPSAPVPSQVKQAKPKPEKDRASPSQPPFSAKAPKQQVLPRGRLCAWLLWSKNPQVIKEAQARITRGEHFVVLAGEIAKRENNKDATHANGGCRQAGDFSAPVHKVLAGLKMGHTAGPFKLAGGEALVMRTTDRHRKKGMAHFKAKRYRKAEKELLADVKLQPVNSGVFHAIAVCRSARGRHAGALKALERAVRLNPSDYRILSDKATTLMNLDRLDQAIATYWKALDLAPQNPVIMGNLAGAIAKKGRDLEQAQDLADQALGRAPGLSSLWVTQAMIQKARGDRASAVVSLHKAARLNPGSKEIEKLLVNNLRALDHKIVSQLAGPGAAAPARPDTKPQPLPQPYVGKSKSKARSNNPGPSKTPFQPGQSASLKEPSKPTRAAEPGAESQFEKPGVQASYYIQTGTFLETSAAAAAMKRLTGVGLEPNLQKWQGPEGQTWHRVMLGPHASRNQALAKARDLVKKGWLTGFLVVRTP